MNSKQAFEEFLDEIAGNITGGMEAVKQAFEYLEKWGYESEIKDFIQSWSKKLLSGESFAPLEEVKDFVFDKLRFLSMHEWITDKELTQIVNNTPEKIKPEILGRIKPYLREHLDTRIPAVEKLYKARPEGFDRDFMDLMAKRWR